MVGMNLKNESGVVIVIVLLGVFLGTIIIGSYIDIVINERRNASWQKHRVQSLFLAEAGIEKGLYYLNNKNNRPNGWTEDGNGQLITPINYEGNLAEGRYKVTIHNKAEKPWLPDKAYLIDSEGIIPRLSSGDIKHKVSVIAGNLGALPIPAALNIFDDGDPENELIKFDSAAWTISGKDINAPGGLPGIAIANTTDSPSINEQLGKRIDQVTGSDSSNTLKIGADAILKDPGLPKNLDAYITYFKEIAIDISGMGTIPPALMGSPGKYQVLYADLSKGGIKIAGNDKGYGVLVLEGDGTFEMVGGSEWFGVVICAGNSDTLLKGGGNGNHIIGALMLANGDVEMNGTADIIYSSETISKVNRQLLLYQVYSWCAGWGKNL